jgi:hypothetical protein
MGYLRLLHEHQALYRNECLKKRRAGGAPDFALVARPGSQYRQADFSLFVKVRIDCTLFVDLAMTNHARVTHLVRFHWSNCGNARQAEIAGNPS